MKLEDYKAWLLEHGEIKEEYERPYNPQCDPPEYKDGSYFLSYDLMYAGLSGTNYQKTEDYSSIDDCREDLIDSGFDYDDRYQEELESWLSYYVEPEEE